jgi:hypothetical protein
MSQRAALGEITHPGFIRREMAQPTRSVERFRKQLDAK